MTAKSSHNFGDVRIDITVPTHDDDIRRRAANANCVMLPGVGYWSRPETGDVRRLIDAALKGSGYRRIGRVDHYRTEMGWGMRWELAHETGNDLDCRDMLGHHSDDRVTVGRGGPHFATYCGRHAAEL